VVEATAMLVQRLYDELSLHVPRELEHDLAVSLTSLQRLPESPYQYASRMLSLACGSAWGLLTYLTVWMCHQNQRPVRRLDAIRSQGCYERGRVA